MCELTTIYNAGNMVRKHIDKRLGTFSNHCPSLVRCAPGPLRPNSCQTLRTEHFRQIRASYTPNFFVLEMSFTRGVFSLLVHLRCWLVLLKDQIKQAFPV